MFCILFFYQVKELGTTGKLKGEKKEGRGDQVKNISADYSDDMEIKIKKEKRLD